MNEELLDFGEMGKWSKKTLLDKVTVYEGVHNNPLVVEEDLYAILNSKLKEVDFRKELKKMTVKDLINIIDKHSYNEKVRNDYHRLIDFVKREGLE